MGKGKKGKGKTGKEKKKEKWGKEIPLVGFINLFKNFSCNFTDKAL